MRSIRYDVGIQEDENLKEYQADEEPEVVDNPQVQDNDPRPSEMDVAARAFFGSYEQPDAEPVNTESEQTMQESVPEEYGYEYYKPVNKKAALDSIKEGAQKVGRVASGIAAGTALAGVVVPATVAVKTHAAMEGVISEIGSGAADILQRAMDPNAVIHSKRAARIAECESAMFSSNTKSRNKGLDF